MVSNQLNDNGNENKDGGGGGDDDDVGEEEKREGRGEDDDKGDESSTLSISLVPYSGFPQPLTMVHTPAFGSHNIFGRSYTQAHAGFPHKVKLYFWL